MRIAHIAGAHLAVAHLETDRDVIDIVAPFDVRGYAS